MGSPPHVLALWAGRRHVHVTVEGAGDAALVGCLDEVLDELLPAGAAHVLVHLDRLTGDDTAVLELLAATCHRVWSAHGTMEIDGLRDRLLSRPEVRAFPEVFGEVRPASAAG